MRARERANDEHDGADGQQSEIGRINMRNVDMRVDGTTLWLGIDLAEEGQESKSGKTLVIASTEGNVSKAHEGKVYKVGLNVYTDK